MLTLSIRYQTSKALAEILVPLVGISEHHVVSLITCGGTNMITADIEK